ncbi:EAL domain-containing protein [Pelagibacterium sp. H642]|uniref:bifunctional diguanylate cyclase/phosphodiesterase n=1 Tax=Pelagibacterium sp. H642 TaxID=1881069 RepID=UPI00281560CA|nr:EAL domain-containing protein [Pelagibacterium sp. H642]WMT91640.1 EAL domain-containing protein [Pelagibacterium sp. H642]
MGRAVFRASNIPTLIALIVIGITVLYAERQNREVYEQSQRTMVLDKVGLVRAQLEGKVNANLQLVHGLVSVISNEPDMDANRFAALASYLFAQENLLINIAAAPELVVRMVYPLEANAAALGLDYTANAAQREAALVARNTREIVLAGPLDLVQGGRGFIGRFPVYYTDDQGREVFWGIVSAVIDADRLYAESGVIETGEIAIAISGRDGDRDAGGVFHGDPAILADNPVRAEVSLPSGGWTIWAAPADGWGANPPNAVVQRMGMGLAAALILVPIILLGRLNDERRRRMDEQRRREIELSRISRRLGLALASSQMGVWELDVETGALTWDARMNELYAYPADGAPRSYRDWRDRLHPDDRERAEDEFAQVLSTGSQYLSNFRIVTPAGEIRHIRAAGSIYQEKGASMRFLGVNWDATPDAKLSEALIKAKTQAEAKNFELETAKARIEHNAMHDPLTGLPNRRYLDHILEAHTRQSAGAKGHVSILHIDLDRFKQINDTLGHAAGDAMLIHAADVLKSAVRPTDFVARIGGDEFVILCLGKRADIELKGLADRIIEAMRKPVSYQGHECRFGVSIGIARGDVSAIAAKQILVNADIALYRAKREGRSRAEFFSEELQAQIVTAKRVADDILAALENDEFVAFYQPQVDAKTLDIVGMEALARWKHPTRGILTPDAFMAVAEDLNVVAAIDELILEQALDQHREWAAAGLRVPRVSVNVSARRLNDEELIGTLRGLDIAPGTVSFELVESIYLDERDSLVSWNIDQIRDLGIDIEIDDFGTGYASIVSLLQLRPNRLKIDRQLVKPITQSAEQRQLVASIVEIGASLGIEAIAEGVETREHVALLAEMGCAALQGYTIARPMAGEDATVFVAAERWREVG